MTEFSNPNFSIDLSDQVALVTGASSGLGYRFAKVLAKCGAKVAISARRVDKLEEGSATDYPWHLSKCSRFPGCLKRLDIFRCAYALSI